MGRRRRRVVRIVKKKLPTVFVCPRCGEEAVRVTIDKDTGHAVVLCALCNLRDDFPAHPAAQPIDVYSYFTDRFYGVKEPRAIIPREREISQAPSGEAETEAVGAPEPPGRMTEESTHTLTEPSETKIEEPSMTSQANTPQSIEPAVEKEDLEDKGPAEESTVEAPATGEPEEQKESEEEAEPFADILENKDKKRYSANPLPQQTSEQTS